MLITTQVSDFIGFVFIGILLAIIFDFFRTYRILKRISTFSVIVQDIIYFFISMFVIAKGIINILNSSMRFYIFIAVILGFVIYNFTLSKYVIKIYKMIFNASKEILEFLLLPFYIILRVIVKLCIIIKKFFKKCCKKFFDMVPFICKLSKRVKKLFNFRIKKLKTKEGKVWEKQHIMLQITPKKE